MESSNVLNRSKSIQKTVTSFFVKFVSNIHSHQWHHVIKYVRRSVRFNGDCAVQVGKRFVPSSGRRGSRARTCLPSQKGLSVALCSLLFTASGRPCPQVGTGRLRRRRRRAASAAEPTEEDTRQNWRWYSPLVHHPEMMNFGWTLWWFCRQVFRK